MQLHRLTISALAALSIVAMSTCSRPSSGPVQPSLVITETTPPNWTSNLVDQIRHGSLSLDDARLQSDLRAAPQCTFASDPASGQQRMTNHGTPGTPGFNVQVLATNISSAGGLTQPCQPNVTPGSVIMQPDPGIVVRQLTRAGSARLEMPNGVVFSTTLGVFEFTLTSFSSTTGMGNFRFVMLSSDPHDPRVMVVTGSFTMPT